MVCRRVHLDFWESMGLHGPLVQKEVSHEFLEVFVDDPCFGSGVSDMS